MTLGDVTRGILSTVTDTTNIKIGISEAIEFLSPFDVPLLDMVGRSSLKKACTQVKHEWLQDELMPSQGTLAAAYVAGSGTITLTSGEGEYLVPGDNVMVDDIIFKVLTGAPDADVIGVEVLGGTDAAIANGSTWRGISHAAQEAGSARNDGVKVHLGRPYNYTQIIKDWIIVSGTMEVISRYGYSKERAYQEAKKLKEMAIKLEKTLLYGARSYSAGPPRESTMGGLFQYVYLEGKAASRNNVVDLATAELTELVFENAMQTIWENGGRPDFVLVGGANKQQFTKWASPRIRTAQGERKAGASVAVYGGDFGDVDILLNRWLRPSDIIIGTRGQLGIGPLTGRAFSSRMLPTTIDGNWWEILGEYTMEVGRPSIDWYWFYNSSTSVT